MTNISVVIPHYEKQIILPKIWAALWPQLDKGDEVIIVDDDSPGGVPDLDSLPWRPGFKPRVINLEPLRPHIYRLNTLRNAGVEESRNDAVAIMDPDCIPYQNWIKNAKEVYDPAILFSGRIDFENEDGSIYDDPRLDSRGSCWIDDTPRGTGTIWGGSMFFSRSRTERLGWFDEDYNGAWGAEDHDFGSRCYHSGMRLRYCTGLRALHVYHRKNQPNLGRNLEMWERKMKDYQKHLNIFTDYKPAVAVLNVTMLRPAYIDQGMRSIFRNRLPVKVLLINQGDNTKETREQIDYWRGRWAVEYVKNEERQPLPKVRNWALDWCVKNKYKYLILKDDDVILTSLCLKRLIDAAERNSSYTVIAGAVYENGKGRCLGGRINQDCIYQDFPMTSGVHKVQYVSTGFTLIRLGEKVPGTVRFPEEYEFGWDDWDFAEQLNKHKIRMAVTGDAVAYHKYMLTVDGWKVCPEPPEYSLIRYDQARNDKMAELFKSRWGYTPQAPRSPEK